MRMRAAVLEAIGEPLSVEEVELDSPKAGEVLVRLGASGVCHSDVNFYLGDVSRDLPLVLGHEGAGEVVEIGPSVTEVSPGDHVVLTFLPSCGRCHWCEVGQPTLCDLDVSLRSGTLTDGTRRLHRIGVENDTLNHHLFVSTYAEYTVVPEASLVKVPKSISFDLLCLLGCSFTTGFGAVTNTARLSPGDSVTIVGCGGVGLAAVQAAAVSGATQIVVIDVDEAKIDLAKRLGATHGVIASDDPDQVVEEVLQITGGRGTRAAIESVGGRALNTTLDIAYRCTEKGGSVLLTGVAPTDLDSIPISPLSLIGTRKRIIGVLFGDARFRTDIDRCIRLLEEGRLDVESLVSKRIELDDINAAFERLIDGTAGGRQIIVY